MRGELSASSPMREYVYQLVYSRVRQRGDLVILLYETLSV